MKQWFPAWKFLISAMSSLVLSKRFHFPARPLCLLIGSLQRFKRKEKIISDIWNQLKWLSVENASILRSLNSVIKWSLSCCKERFALKWFLRQREIRLFLPRRKILLNPYGMEREKNQSRFWLPPSLSIPSSWSHSSDDWGWRND